MVASGYLMIVVTYLSSLIALIMKGPSSCFMLKQRLINMRFFLLSFWGRQGWGEITNSGGSTIHIRSPQCREGNMKLKCVWMDNSEKSKEFDINMSYETSSFEKLMFWATYVNSNHSFDGGF